MYKWYINKFVSGTWQLAIRNEYILFYILMIIIGFILNVDNETRVCFSVKILTDY